MIQQNLCPGHVELIHSKVWGWGKGQSLFSSQNNTCVIAFLSDKSHNLMHSNTIIMPRS